MCRGKIILVCFLAAIAVAGLARAEDPPDFILAWGSEGSGAGQFVNPQDVAVDYDGNVYVADTGNRRVQKFTSGGMFLREWGEEGTGDGQFMSPVDVAIDAEGNVWVGDNYLYGSRLQKFDSNGGFLLSLMGPGRGIAADDHVFVLLNGVTKLDLDGNVLANWGSATPYPATDIAVDEVENVFVSEHDEDWFNDRNWISVFLGDGTLVSVTEISGISNLFKRLAVDGGDHVYATADENKVVLFDYAVQFLLQWGEPGTGEGQFDNPTGVAVDEVGGVYVADSGNHRIQKFGYVGAGYECVGFMAPMDRGPVTPSPNRVLPFKAQLMDAGGVLITDLDISSPPRIEVAGDSGVLGDPEPPLEELPPSAATEGNEFEYNPATDLWVYHLRASDYTSAATYTVTMESGDTSEYVINPTCTAEFVIE